MKRALGLFGGSRSGVAVALFALISGCGEKELPPEVLSLEGTIEKIERTSDTTGKVTVVYYSEKQKQEIPGTGVINRETDIQIDGAAAILKDLKEGDRVQGEVRVEKKGGKRMQTVLRIKVDRGKSSGQ